MATKGFVKLHHLAWLVGLLVYGTSLVAMEKNKPLHFYIDADFTGVKESSLSIEAGILTALSEVGNKIGGRNIKVIKRDHRGNSRRSRKHLDEYLADPHALVIFGGLHSPPLLANKKYINSQGILTLVPWAAAGPITRSEGPVNWIFRLSLDDSKVGQVLVDYGIKQRGGKKPFLLLERTGWGRNNYKTITTALDKLKVAPPVIRWFDWNISKEQAGGFVQELVDSGADLLFFVGNAPEGKTFFKELSKSDRSRKIVVASHWGITGGDFHRVVDARMRSKLDLRFAQSRFSFTQKRQSPLAQEVFRRLQTLYPDILKPEDVKAHTGFVHAYDLTMILLEAIAMKPLPAKMFSARALVRNSLEGLSGSVTGLIKTYRTPFSPYSRKNIDAHEALEKEDFCMGYYNQQGAVILENCKK